MGKRRERTEYRRAYYLAHREREIKLAKQKTDYRKQAKRTNRTRNRELRAQLNPEGCIVKGCTWSNQLIIDWHHIDPETKQDYRKSTVNELSSRKDPTQMLQEMLLCVPLCRCHHALYHAGEDIGLSYMRMVAFTRLLRYRIGKQLPWVKTNSIFAAIAGTGG